MLKLSEKTRTILLFVVLALVVVNTVQLACIQVTKSYDDEGLVYAVVKAFTPATKIGLIREREENRISNYVDKLMAIHKADETALGRHGMGLAMGDPEKLAEPLYRCQKFVKARYYEKYPTMQEGSHIFGFVNLDYFEVNEFIELEKGMISPDQKIPDFMLEKLEFDRCVLIGFVRFDETHQREVFHWRQEARYGLSPTRKAAPS